MGETARTDLFDGREGVFANVLVTLAIQLAVVAVVLVLDALGFSQATGVIIFVLGVLLTALFTSDRVYCYAASALSVLCFNFFLVDPRYSLHVWGAEVPGTLAVMLVVALIASYLVTQMRKSARASTEASLKAQNEQLRADLLRSVSHDLRTPLTSISGNADMLLDQDIELTEQERVQILQAIYDDATWLTGMVENLLAVTRLDEGKVALRQEVELVDDVVEEAMRHVSRDAERHELVVVPSDELLLARMDPHIVVQVVVNLVNNAIAHTEQGSCIQITTSREGDFAAISVADDGEGVSDADKQYVFEPFYTTNRTAADSRRGIGLGLALCRTLVEAHGGTLRVEDAVPHGAVFTFTLPLVEVPESSRSEQDG